MVRSTSRLTGVDSGVVPRVSFPVVRVGIYVEGSKEETVKEQASIQDPESTRMGVTKTKEAVDERGGKRKYHSNVNFRSNVN